MVSALYIPLAESSQSFFNEPSRVWLHNLHLFSAVQWSPNSNFSVLKVPAVAIVLGILMLVYIRRILMVVQTLFDAQKEDARPGSTWHCPMAKGAGAEGQRGRLP